MSWLSPSCPLHLVEGPRALGWHGLEFLLQQMGQELRKAMACGLPRHPGSEPRDHSLRPVREQRASSLPSPMPLPWQEQPVHKAAS